MKKKSYQIMSVTSKIEILSQQLWTKLYSRNGTLLNNEEEILAETMNHFKSLYSKNPVKTSILIHCLKTPTFQNFLINKLKRYIFLLRLIQNEF